MGEGRKRGWEIGEKRKILEGWKKVSEQFKDVHDPLKTSNSLMQMLMSRFVFPLNYQKTESQSSSQNARDPITKSLEDFMIDRLPNQSPVHDLQVHVLYFLLIKIVCAH